jgi:hypothetical protein
MSKKFRLPKIFNHLGVWIIPFVSVTSFVPIFLTYGLPSKSPTERPKSITPLPSLNQIPSISQLEEQPFLSEDSLISPSATPQTPQPQATIRDAAVSSAKAPPTQQPKQKEPIKSPKSSDAPKSTPVVDRKSENPLFPSLPNYRAPKLEIKVAILRDAESTVIGTSTQASIQDRSGRLIETISASQGFAVQPNGNGLTIGDWQLPYAVWLQPSAGGFVYVGDRWYRGKLLLVSQGSTLLAVNYLDLEDYLYSVVGSEMHSNAPLAALKAQAIAARSYAIVHMIRPASEWYHLGATQRWQAYKGLEREYNTTHQAVNETAGQILSYKGGIVESLYAATDEIVSNVHQGIGMSQTGAYDLATQGYDYQQILGRYYPGVSLARLTLNQ